MDDLTLLHHWEKVWNKIHSSMYGIDSETQFLSQWKLLSYEDLVPSMKLILINASLFPAPCCCAVVYNRRFTVITKLLYDVIGGMT